MAEQEFFSINPSTHIRTTSENRPFYDLLVDEKHIFSTKYQLYTFAIMVALRAGVAPDSATKIWTFAWWEMWTKIILQ